MTENLSKEKIEKIERIEIIVIKMFFCFFFLALAAHSCSYALQGRSEIYERQEMDREYSQEFRKACGHSE